MNREKKRPGAIRIKRALSAIEKAFLFSVPDMRTMVRGFHAEMEIGLKSGMGSLKMIPAFTDRPTGREKGRFLAIDLGGTNLRVLEVELKGSGKKRVSQLASYPVEKGLLSGSGEGLFDYVAGHVKAFIRSHGLDADKGIRAGFTFSFPVKQAGIASGRLVSWTKGFKAKGVVGRDVVAMLEGAFKRQGVSGVRIAALINDTVGTLAARSYEDPSCDVAVIIGTGTNACYRDAGRRMIINIEWGNFRKFRRTPYDFLLDAASDNPKEQALEKAAAGMYLGEIVRQVLVDMAKEGLIFSGLRLGKLKERGSLKTEDMSSIESDNPPLFSRTAAFLRRKGVDTSCLEDRVILKRICGIVSKRAARICAAAIAAVVTRIDPGLSKIHTVAIDGSVYEKHPYFKALMRGAIKQLLGRKARMIRAVLAKGASGEGAAMIAAVASEEGE